MIFKANRKDLSTTIFSLLFLIIISLSNYQQQFDFVSEQPHDGSEFLSIPFIIPAAHPTPELTKIACTGQFRAHAPHSMQESRLMIRAFFPESSKTLCGHTFIHIPHPLQLSSHNLSVTTSGRYIKSFMWFILNKFPDNL
jgi:hypothetical protein